MGSILKIIAGAISAFNAVMDAMRRKQDRDAGAAAQREKTHDDMQGAITGDRVRDADPAFGQRVRNDHGISTDP